ncbi:MAG: hypothetical protein LCH52_14640 [Bacteroidetes bacterium]|nr:hypothetical protein [Bacteroidota bacterium]
MKTDILNKAIKNRNKIRFYYSMQQLVIDPYIISCDKEGKKTIYGKISDTDTIQKFEFRKIYNIKVLEQERFAPRVVNTSRFQ